MDAIPQQVPVEQETKAIVGIVTAFERIGAARAICSLKDPAQDRLRLRSGQALRGRCRRPLPVRGMPFDFAAQF